MELGGRGLEEARSLVGLGEGAGISSEEAGKASQGAKRVLGEGNRKSRKK